MSVRNIHYTVTPDGIIPATEQIVGVQTEQNATELIFTLQDELYHKLLVEKKTDDVLKYRFDLYNSIGNEHKTKPETLENNIVRINIGEWLSRSGGRATVYLVITRLNANTETETELISYPACIRFIGKPYCGGENNRESLTALMEAARLAAEQATAAQLAAEVALGRMQTLKAALENDSVVVLDGGNASGYLGVDFVVDNELSKNSNNAISNSAVAKALREQKTNIETAAGSISHSFNIASTDDDLKKIYPSLYCIKHILTDIVCPIGDVIITYSDMNPSNRYGGTWEQIGQGRCLIGAGQSTKEDGGVYEVGNTGGCEEQALTVENLAAHNHQFKEGSHSWTWGKSDATVRTNALVEQGSVDYSTFLCTYEGEYDVTKSSGGTYNSDKTEIVQQSVPHNNMQPYLVVYMWRRKT